jgi:hypothetical protein
MIFPVKFGLPFGILFILAILSKLFPPECRAGCLKKHVSPLSILSPFVPWDQRESSRELSQKNYVLHPLRARPPFQNW